MPITPPSFGVWHCVIKKVQILGFDTITTSHPIFYYHIGSGQIVVVQSLNVRPLTKSHILSLHFVLQLMKIEFCSFLKEHQAS